jgi:hypothetical protein
MDLEEAKKIVEEHRMILKACPELQEAQEIVRKAEIDQDPERGLGYCAREEGTWIEEPLKKRLRWSWSSTSQFDVEEVPHAGVDVHIVSELKDKSPEEIRAMAARLSDVMDSTLDSMFRQLQEEAGDPVPALTAAEWGRKTGAPR